MKRIASLLPLLGAVFLGACVSMSPLKPEELEKVRPMAIVPSRKGAEGDLYHDTTSQAFLRIGAQTDLLGSVIFGGLASVEQSNGIKKFQPTIAGCSEIVMSTLVSSTQAALLPRGYVNAQAGGELGRLRLTNVHYGVIHQGDQRFLAWVSVVGEIETRRRVLIWHSAAGAVSSTTFTREEAVANPKIYQDAVIEAARRAATVLTAKI